MKYEILLFDLDGTLIDSRTDLANAVNAMLGEFGYDPLDTGDVVSAVGDGVTVLIERCLAAAGAADVSADRAKPHFIEYYTGHLADHTTPYDGVIETLEHLDNVPMAVVTNKMEHLSRELLETLGLAKYFNAVVGGDSLEERKPSGMQITHVCRQLGVDPERGLMVGDSVNDLRAAKAAGADSAAVLYGLQPEERLKKEQATHYLPSFPSILGVLH